MTIRYPKLIKPAKCLSATNMRMPGRRRAILSIYAVVLRDHPSVVKVGRTVDWEQRRRSYDYWNLRKSGDGVIDYRLFVLNEEYVDLAALESAILLEMPVKPMFGAEWFETDMETACRVIDRIMCEGGLSYSDGS